MDYILDMSYQEIKDYIREKLIQTQNNFIEIGFRLRQVQDGQLYKADGYKNINEFAKAEYDLNQSDTSRFIAINERFSEGGYGQKLLLEYQQYGSSKLSEMLGLTDEEIKLVSLRTTRVEIREIKQAKREAEGSENSEIYAPAHKSQSLENTQSNQDFSNDKNAAFPDGISLMIEFFRDKSRRETLKQLAVLLREGTSRGSVSEAAAEIVNPSGHLMFKKILVVMMFEEDHIKYNKFGSPVQQFTYMDLLNDTAMAFDMAAEDPWVEFYGEPEPEPEKPAPKAETPPKSDSKKKEPPKPAKPQKNTQSKESHQAAEPEEILPGQKVIDDYPEILPEGRKVRSCRVCGCTDDHACEGGCYWVEPDLCSTCFDKLKTKGTDSLAKEPDKVEIVEADIVQTKPKKSDRGCQYCKKDAKPLLEYKETEAYEIYIEESELVFAAPVATGSRIKINYCPRCGRPLENEHEA